MPPKKPSRAIRHCTEKSKLRLRPSLTKIRLKPVTTSDMKMVRVLLAIAALLCIATRGWAAQKRSASDPSPRLMSGLGDVHHAVSTKNAQAQAFFDQGLKLIYGFNHDEARHCFQHAA